MPKDVMTECQDGNGIFMANPSTPNAKSVIKNKNQNSERLQAGIQERFEGTELKSNDSFFF